LRRTSVRNRKEPPLRCTAPPRVRSLAYLQTVIQELRENPVPDGYVGYLRLELRSLIGNADPAKIQKTTLSEDC
jgi:hypothetical protein